MPSHDLDKINLVTTVHGRQRLKTVIIVLTIDQRAIIAHKIPVSERGLQADLFKPKDKPV